ncbi:MAG: UDP binding domain-containing protein, partial [Burkholderiales bacterium]|nr:UDP binding domain-containing protein [Burkholderiales bacterium]
VDPYYLTHKAQAIGYLPEIILAGRRLNDSMSSYVVSQVVKTMTQRDIHMASARVLVMGLSFKENCPDLRNSRVLNIVNELRDYHCEVDVFDPWVKVDEVQDSYGISPITDLVAGSYDAVVIAVAHKQFKLMGANSIRALCKPSGILYDLKYVLASNEADLRL